MAASIRDLKTQLATLGYNPSAAQRAVLQSWSDVSSGKITVVDPSNPVVLALESACVLVDNAMTKNAVLDRRQYARNAQTQDDLYLHMSDVDYLGRFATPVTDTFTMLLPYAQLMSMMVPDPATGIKKVVIPRNTQFTVANTTFCLQYPIEIRLMQHGGLQIVYDTSEISPIQTITNNRISSQLVSSDGTTVYLKFSFQVTQLLGKSVTQNANAATLFEYQYAYTDQYYYCRVWTQNTDGTWTEILTTHTALVYDITKPTAVLQVDEDTNILTVKIPQIYTATGVIKGQVRIDMYTTKGALQMVLGNYSMEAFQIKFQAFDSNDITQFTSPLQSLSSMFVWSTSTLDGGSNGMSFATLQAQVVNNSVGPKNAPISNVNLQDTLADLGFTVVTNIDNITNRTFLATRTLPLPTQKSLITAAGTTNSTVTFSLDQLSGLSYVVDNSATENAMTLTPDALFKDVNGIVSLVTDGEIDSLDGLPADQKALMITNGNYLYTPFHYVLDSNNNGFAVRPYYLDAPSIPTKLYYGTNGLTLLQVNISDTYEILRTSTGYKVRIQTVSGASFQALSDDQVFVQMAFVPEGERDRAYLAGTLIGYDSTGKERVYEFDLSSNMNVDANDCIQLTQFLMYTTEPRVVASPLTQNFDIIFSTSAVMDVQWEAGEPDTVMGKTFLPAGAVGITHEGLQIQFGESLDTLWARARSVVSTIVYETYDQNVPLLYTSDVYQRDPVTGSAITIVNGQPTWTILHHKGDPVLDNNGDPVYQYTAGQIKLDPATGAPIPSNPRGMSREIDFMLIEGVYKFATDDVSAAYRTEMLGTLLTWMTGSLETLNSELLEQSRLYFYPKKTIGQVDIMIGASIKTTMEAGQSLTLTLYVSSDVYKNTDLRAQLTVKATQTLALQLTAAQVARDALEEALAIAFGNDVVGLELHGLGSAAQDLPIFTILDDSIRASLRKKLLALTDNSLVLTEDLTVIFVQHDESVIDS